MIWSDSRGRRSCQGAQCHVEMEGRRRGAMAVFVFGTRLLSSSVHSCTDTQRGLQANADMHMSTRTNTQMHPIHATKKEPLNFMCASSRAHAHLHTSKHCHASCNGAWKKCKISYYFQRSNLERMCFFFLHNEHIDFFPSEFLWSVCILLTEHWSSPHWNVLFLWVLELIWKAGKMVCNPFLSPNFCMHFPLFWFCVDVRWEVKFVQLSWKLIFTCPAWKKSACFASLVGHHDTNTMCHTTNSTIRQRWYLTNVLKSWSNNLPTIPSFLYFLHQLPPSFCDLYPPNTISCNTHTVLFSLPFLSPICWRHRPPPPSCVTGSESLLQLDIIITHGQWLC